METHLTCQVSNSDGEEEHAGDVTPAWARWQGRTSQGGEEQPSLNEAR